VSELELARTLARAAAAAIDRSRRRIDDLNVYPVPDGDTGTNLTLTVQAVADALEQSSAADRAALCHEITRAALMGARGNSGVILSQIVRGACESLARSDDLRAAFRAAADAAYRAVRKPVEGTMLTAIRELAEEAEASRGETPAELLRALVRRGDDCVARTRELLDVLREAGVVDAGAAGLVEIVRGIAAAVSGEPLPEAAPHDEHDVAVDAIHQELSRFRYCTVFVVEGDGLDADALEAELERLGDSLLVVGDPTAIKVHVHTDDPGKALSLGVAAGTIAGVEVANMHVQTAQREERLAATGTSEVVAVVAGDGNRRLFESLGARVVDGGPTFNPSTYELLAGIHEVPADEVLVLPNSPNVVMAAERAVTLSEKAARLVRCTSQQAGLLALVEALGLIRVAAIAPASRDDGQGRFVRGDAVGFLDDEIVAWGGAGSTLATMVERLAEAAEIITVIGGEGAPIALSELSAHVPEGVELELHDGGQAHYWWLLAAQ
jgi:DAK2 domain fusion protein YloV